eukprot:3306329-Pleurochrysis_carterae.AAC.1
MYLREFRANAWLMRDTAPLTSMKSPVPDRRMVLQVVRAQWVVVGPLEQGAVLNRAEGVAPPTNLVGCDVRMQRMAKRDDAVLAETELEHIVKRIAS